MQQQPCRLGVEVDPIARQLLIAVQDRHHRQQQRITRQHRDRLGIADRLLQSFEFRSRLRRVVEGLLVPTINEGVDLSSVQVLQHEVPELGFTQLMRLIADHTRRHHDRRLRVFGAETLDVVDHFLARLQIKDLVQPIQQQHDPARLGEQLLQQPGRPVVPDRSLFQEPDKSLSPVAFPAAIGTQVDDQRNRLRVPRRAIGDAGPTQGQIANQRGLAGTRIAQYHQPMVTARRCFADCLINDLQHRAQRLLEILAPHLFRLLLAVGQFLFADLARFQQTLLMVFGNLQQPRVVLMAFPRRLRDEDAPQPHAAVVRPRGIEHLEVDLVEPLRHGRSITFRIEFRRQYSRNARPPRLGDLAAPRPSRIVHPQVEVVIEDPSEVSGAGVFGEEDGIVEVLHPLPEGSHFLPLIECSIRLIGISGQLQLLDLAEEPLDLREAGGVVSLFCPLELFLGPRFRLAARRAESLRHDADHHGQRVFELLQCLLRDQFLRPADADRRVVLPVDHFELSTPQMSGAAVVIVEEPPDMLPLPIHIAGGREEDVVDVDVVRFQGHR